VREVVLDAGVAAKWWLPGKEEQLRDEALDLLKRYAEGKFDSSSPICFGLNWETYFGKQCDNDAIRGPWRKPP
jgi:hypothetical protein